MSSSVVFGGGPGMSQSKSTRVTTDSQGRRVTEEITRTTKADGSVEEVVKKRTGDGRVQESKRTLPKLEGSKSQAGNNIKRGGPFGDIGGGFFDSFFGGGGRGGFGFDDDSDDIGPGGP
uniref:Uncharacterized protein n=1 Tax=Amorphochlora amoebiformis TaxID=1561963 RepID=A0A7S0D4Q8_9EUKA|mmetsp:Transcript_18030/g.28719  ORF Transcript_18030/g.28719 Transcript_18030/m.28719 type:complete len:119 (+) Transcript_18030:127-483(+)